ncbi:Mediator of RNA polymerase II transcription subunit 31, partial [Armadillidium nasatum]
TEDTKKLRFQVELEFVQCLANPNYVNFLAQRGYFKEKTFINYLKYLLYWKEPEYAKFLKYPMCLYYLDLLQYESFRKEIINAQCCKFIDDQMLLHWQHYTRKRMKFIGISGLLSEEDSDSSSSASDTPVSQALSEPSATSNMPDKIILRFYDSIIHESDLKLLEGRNWLNDSLISFWFEHLHHNVFYGRSDLLFISPEVTQLIKMGDQCELPLFLDPLNARYRRYIFLPVNNNSSLVSSGGSHWSLLVYSKYDQKWFHYDSQKGSNYRDARSLVYRINSYMNRYSSATLEDAECSQQDNSYDCGAFVMLHAQKVAENATKSLDLGTCLVQRSEAYKMREVIFDLINRLKR